VGEGGTGGVRGFFGNSLAEEFLVLCYLISFRTYKCEL